VDQRAIEDLFERNADMRLLEFRHNEPGKGAPPNKRAAGSFGSESIVANTPDAAIEDAPRLRVAVAVAPKIGVIPGAVVGVAIDVFNDGTAPAPESKLLISIPIESEYRPGSLRVDGREVPSPEALFAQGLPIARLPGATSSKVTFQLGILPGVNTLYLQPRLQTNGVPVVGSVGATIKRGGAPPAPAEPPRPFYELEDDEVAEVAAVVTEPILPPVLPAPPAPEPPAPALAVAAPVELPEPPVEAPAPPPPAAVVVLEPPPPAPVPEPPAPRKRKEPAAVVAPKLAPRTTKPADERMQRYRTLGSNDVGLLDRLFVPDVPGIIAHYVLISSIACSEPGAGEDTSGYGDFLRRDIELLGRALVHSRMGKTPQYRIAQSDLDGLALAWQLSPGPSFPPRRRLRRDLRKPEWTAMSGLIKPSERDATLRTRIALLTLAASTLDGVDQRNTAECESSLAAYRSALLAWLVPLCVASAASDSFVIPAPPATVDAAGRRLVGALKSALAS
jgi:hypothetical protein